MLFLAFAAVLGPAAHDASAQDASPGELSELRALVRQQAAALQSMQRRLDSIEAREQSGRPRPGSAPRLAQSSAPQLSGAPQPSGVSQPSAAAGQPPVAPKPGGEPNSGQAGAAPGGAAGNGPAGDRAYTLEAPPFGSPLTVGPAGKVPAPASRNVAVTQQPGNLPGRSAVQPYTAANVATPGALAPIPAAPISAGADRIRLSLSGQVDRMILFGSDGKASGVRNVDNGNSSTRLRIVGEGVINDTASGGVNVETELRPNPSATTTLTQNLPQPAASAGFTVRQAEAYLQDTRYGGVRLGFGSTASYLTTEVDLSGTAVASYVNYADLNGGFAFRQRRAALVPTSATNFVLSPAGAYGPAVGAVFNFFDGLVRDDRIRYDSPVWHGLQLATSAVDGGAFDVALRYAAEFDGNQVVAAGAFADAVSRHHIAATSVAGYPGAVANLYGYAGVPTGANGTVDLATPASPTTGDVSANGSKQFDGSVSLLLKNGLNFTVAGGYRNTSYRDPEGRRLTPTMVFGKVGYRANLFPGVGVTAVSVDYGQNMALQFAGDHARGYSFAAVQNIDAAAAELFFTARVETLNRTYATYNDLLTFALGARVRF